jgi:hypothetical protein
MRWRKVKVTVVMTVMVIYFYCLMVAEAVHSNTKSSMTVHQIRQRQQQQQSIIVYLVGISDGSTRFSMGVRTIKQNSMNNAVLRSTTNLSNRQLDKDNQQSLSLIIRGGAAAAAGNEKTIEWLLTNDPEIFFCGSIFSFVCLLYGAACAIDPRGTARLLYGHEKMAPEKVGQNNNNNRATKRREALIKPTTTTTPNADDSSTIKFLMRSMGSTVFGLGLMAAFSISLDSNQRSKGTSTSYFPAMAIGFLPRSLLYFWYAFIKAPTLLQYTNSHKKRSAENLTSLVWVTAFLISLMSVLQVSWRPPSTISVPYGMALLLTPIAFALLERYHILPASLPSSTSHSCSTGEHISNAKKIGTRHEILLIRQLLLFSSMYAVMVLTLLLPNATNSSGTTSFPAIGLSALTMFLTQIILSVKDYKNEVDRNKLANMKPSTYKFGWNDVATWMALWIGIISLKGSHMDIYPFLSNLYGCPCND